MSAASVFPRDGSALDLFDKRCSSPIFRLQLPLILEAPISIPGCFFGMPAFHVAAPGLLTLLALQDKAVQWPSDALPTVGALTILIVVWFYVNSRPERLRRARMLYSPPSLIVSPIIGLLLAHKLAREDADAIAVPCFYLCAWYTSIIPVLGLKKLANRRRPVASDHLHLGNESAAYAARGKGFVNITAMLRKNDPNASFPSGDVAGAVAFAYPLLSSNASTTLHLVVGVACIALSSFGRMYFLAHHLLDVVCGGLCSAVTCLLCELAMGGISNTQLWHPAAAFTVLVVFAKTTKSDQSAPGQRSLAAVTAGREKNL